MEQPSVVKTLRTIWQVTKLAFAPIPKVQESVQAITLTLALLGIAINPEETLSRLSLSFADRLALLFGVLALLFGHAAVRLQSKFNNLPITFEFEEYERFMATIRFNSYRKNADDHFIYFKLDVQLFVRPVNNSDRAVDLKSVDLLLMKKRFLNSPKVFLRSKTGNELLIDNGDKKSIYLRFDRISIEAKTRGHHYIVERDFDLSDTYGLLLLAKEKYFLRLTLGAVAQPKVCIDLIPDWDAVLDKKGSMKMLKAVRF